MSVSSNSLFTGSRSPFDPAAEAAYGEWREARLARQPRSLDELYVEIEEPARLTEAERAALRRALARSNFVLYRWRGAPADDRVRLRQLGRQLGLERLDSNLCADGDGITSLRVAQEPRQGEYIPYTSRPLNWHTDGYYNSPAQQIRGVILHCVRPAASGGENRLMDHEIAYILLRDENPDHVRALMEPDAMTIPPNVVDGVEIRPQQSGPVFSVDAAGRLHMRYSARARNIVWKDDAPTRAAARCLLNLFQPDSPYIFRHRLEAGEGIISNNVLHCREAFEDPEGAQGRLLYRARYFDRSGD
ncbi:MAG TPA: taurine catabolism dioxygenase TauD [Gammaproteobacteria bacterium]|nr:taurine catabolism dioxygenase TauD [Gammaproteobacteria bacterium]